LNRKTTQFKTHSKVEQYEINMTQQDLPISVSVVDDDEPILDAVTLVLENQEWEVRAYTNGEAFLDDLLDSRPDLLLLDSHLPGINGVEVVERLKDDMVTFPVIILTAHPSSVETRELGKLVDTEILIKPVTESVLVQSCRKLLALNG
jgi:FixJ family two-component response regulator